MRSHTHDNVDYDGDFSLLSPRRRRFARSKTASQAVVIVRRSRISKQQAIFGAARLHVHITGLGFVASRRASRKL